MLKLKIEGLNPLSGTKTRPKFPGLGKVLPPLSPNHTYSTSPLPSCPLPVRILCGRPPQPQPAGQPEARRAPPAAQQAAIFQIRPLELNRLGAEPIAAAALVVANFGMGRGTRGDHETLPAAEARAPLEPDASLALVHRRR